MCSLHLSSVIKEIQRRANSIKRASSNAVFYPLGPLFVLYNIRLLVHVSALSSPVLCHPILISTVRIKNTVEYNERNHTVLKQSRVQYSTTSSTVYYCMEMWFEEETLLSETQRPHILHVEAPREYRDDSRLRLGERRERQAHWR